MAPAGLFDACVLNYRQPVLATSPTVWAPKVASRRSLDNHDTIGFDLMGMFVDDLVVWATSRFLRDRLHRLRAGLAERIAAIV
ncbi:MAG: hypothetical protein IPJ61_17840 [Tessaracoccus sp.]|uniref:hypothetical protein n=1 Tax=Tessaracoccus sp. TaxID=1971211 RepID=UPI001EBCF9A3|nr:hypothetical protein [Tessaracoccus sp.]MBK7822866.1 hypothetical protein [Tessaracoccus sp.]